MKGSAIETARRGWAPSALCVALLLTWLVFAGIGDPYWTSVAVKLFITLIVVLGLQIFSGNSGVLSFGHVGFMAIGAYGSALLTMPQPLKEASLPDMPQWLAGTVYPAQLSPFLGVVAGGLLAMLVAALLAGPIVRLAGVAAAIATLAIIVIINVFINETPSITSGQNTLLGVPQTTTLAAVVLWAVAFVVVAFAFGRSKVGLRLRASRENERAAKSIGIRITPERGLAWVLSAFVVGVAGALYGHYFTTFSAADFYFNNGLNLILLTIAMLVVGGMTSVTGAVAGCYAVSVVYAVFNRWEVTGFFGYAPPSGVANLAVALLLVVALIVRPNGLTNGRELPWIGAWRLPRRGDEGEAPPTDPPARGQRPAIASGTD